MNQYLTSFYIFIHLIINILSQTQNTYNFGKYEKFTTQTGYAVFDPTKFNFGEMMFFKISASSFQEDKLYYEYADDLTGYTFQHRNDLYYVKGHGKTEKSDGDDDDEKKTEIQYFNIEKKQDDLKGQQGIFLILYFFTIGATEIENTEDDEGKMSIIIIVLGLIVLVIIIVVLLICCFKNR